MKGKASAIDAALTPLLERMRIDDEVGVDCRREIGEAAQGLITLSAGEVLREQEQRADILPVLCEGVVLATRKPIGGAQQHTAIHVAGDMLDLEGFILGSGGTALRACSGARVVLFSRPNLDDLLARHAQLARHVRREMAINANIAREWMVNLGRRSAYQRAAHLLCEISTRLNEAGSIGESVMDIPLTQTDLSNLLGLSVVHMNRKLQELRREGIIEFRHGKMKVLDAVRLMEAAGFDPGYLGVQAAV